jgi:cytidylate kinase
MIYRSIDLDDLRFVLPNAIRSFLLRKKWNQIEVNRSGRWELYRKTVFGFLYEVFLPLDTSNADYAFRIADAVVTMSEADSISIKELIRSLEVEPVVSNDEIPRGIETVHATKAERKKGTEPLKVLIVGDWVLDEYWVLVGHQSDISTHTGRCHYRLLFDPGDSIRGLCGAGHVARVLHFLKKNDSGQTQEVELYGIGRWSATDTELIGHLVHRCDCTKARTSIKITWCEKDYEEDIKLVCLDDGSPTVRVIRQYHHVKKGLDQLCRIDWEPKNDGMALEENIYKEKLLTLPENVDGIIVQDLRKGTVDRSLVKCLKERYEKTKWFIRSKIEKPEWLDDIKDDVELRVICPDVLGILSPWKNWLCEDRISYKTYEILNKKKDEGKNVVLLSSQREVIALTKDKQRSRKYTSVVVGKSTVEPTLLNQLGWADAIYASLVFFYLSEKNKGIDREVIDKALTTADEHLAIELPKSINSSKKEKRKPLVSGPECWEKVKRDWDGAMNVAKKKGDVEEEEVNIGVIRKKGDLYLEVWRASTDLPGYIACIKEKREILYKIGRELESFRKNASPARPLSIMIQADPGSGKTTLAESLAKSFGFSIVKHDITQMMHRDELIDLFDIIATKQANGEENILVFVDEINARIEGDPVYGAFLSPLEGSLFVRRSRSFSLKPCVWIFAGTDLEEDGVSLRSGYKLKDFKARMTRIEFIDFNKMTAMAKKNFEDNKQIAEWDRIRKEAKLEQVYLGAKMIKNYFSDVKEISKEVLYGFYSLKPEESPARKIRRMGSSLRNVQYGEITRSNCEKWDSKWRGIQEGKKMVKIVF